MAGVTSKKDLNINPQKRSNTENIIIATASNAEDVYDLLVQGVDEPNSEFFQTNANHITNKDTLQELYGIAERTYQYWSYVDNRKPTINHHAIALLTLNLHPNLKVERR